MATKTDDSLESFLMERVSSLLAQGECTKRSSVRIAISDAIRDGVAQPAALLPSERRLVNLLGVSLGTVQAALSELVQSGKVSRRQGDGTRVCASDELSSQILHFRFLDPKGQVRLEHSECDIRIDHVFEIGPHTAFLGQDDEGYVRIRRNLTLSNGAAVWAAMFLNRRLVPQLPDAPPIELMSINIRSKLEETYGLQSTGVVHRIGMLSPLDAADLGFQSEADAPVFDIQAMVSAPNDIPFYYQRILTSSNACRLELTSGRRAGGDE